MSNAKRRHRSRYRRWRCERRKVRAYLFIKRYMEELGKVDHSWILNDRPVLERIQL